MALMLITCARPRTCQCDAAHILSAAHASFLSVNFSQFKRWRASHAQATFLQRVMLISGAQKRSRALSAGC
eukprot:3936247-Rhodomonas_salina.1